MDIEKLVKAYKKEKDRSVADRMLLIIFIQRDEMSVTGAARRLNKARSWGVKWHRRYLEDGTDGLRDRPRPGRPPKVHKGVMEEDTEADKKDCLLGGRKGAEFHKEDDRRRVQSHVCPRDDAKMGILHESSGNEARQQGRQQENCQVQEANEEDSGDGRQGVDGGRPRRVDCRGRFEAPKGGLHAGTQAGRIHVQRIPYQDHRLRVYHRRRRGILQAVCGIYQGRSLWTFWRRRTSGSARP